MTKTEFINLGDPDLICEVHEEQMVPDSLTFAEFLKRYQEKHREKYGEPLKPELKFNKN